MLKRLSTEFPQSSVARQAQFTLGRAQCEGGQFAAAAVSFEKALRETLLQYNGMLVGVFDLLRAKEEEIEARARLAELKRDCRLAQLGLQHLLAGGSPLDRSDMSRGAPVQGDRGKEGH